MKLKTTLGEIKMALGAYLFEGKDGPYEVGYQDGERSGYADWAAALGELDFIDDDPWTPDEFIKSLNKHLKAIKKQTHD